MFSRRQLLAALPLVLLAASPWPARAGVMDIFPVRIELGAAQRVGSVQVRNAGTTPMTYQVELFAWSQSDNEDVLTATGDVLANPPLFTLAPGETQLVRMALRNPASRAVEGTYRLFIREVPQASAARGVGLNVALNASIPVFIAPDGPARPELVATASSGGAPGRVRVAVENRGNAHAQVLRVNVVERGGASEHARLDTPFYVLPGQARSFELPVKALGRRAPLDVQIQTSKETYTVPLAGIGF